MSEIVTASTLNEEIKIARDAMWAASEWSKDAAVNKPRAEIAYENAFAKSFARLKEEGCTDALAKQKALLETTVERQKFYELKEELMVAKAQLHAVGSLFDAYRQVAYVASQEMRFAS